MVTFLLILVGWLLGAWIDEDASWFFGAAVGGLLAWLFRRERQERVEVEQRLTAELQSLRALAEESRAELARWKESAPASPPGNDGADLDSPPAEATALPSLVPVDAVEVPQLSPPADEAEADAPSPASLPPAAPSLRYHRISAPPANTWLKELVLGGNTVVRVGIVVLLVGVTLLLKYAAEHSLFPIEFRLAGGAATGLVLTMLGVCLRRRRRGFGETLQGGGIAAMYLVVFFSFRVYGLLPAGLAFGLLAAIAALSAVLAVVQNAMALLVIGQAGGFLAPILASTGKGDHVALFSYYLVLNVAIACVAWFRAWRPLNLLGFAFTFGIGTAWGVLRYQPEQLASTEPFLVGFFLLYVAIPVLFALRAPAKGWVDGTLVFGAPLTFLALQLALVRDVPFGMAFSTVGLACLYLALTGLLRRAAFADFSLMRSSFLALGVGFGTLAIPYAFDSSGMSAAIWAVEGAGLYYLGVRQAHVLSRTSGVALQILAGAALVFASDHPVPSGALPFLHGRVLAAVFLAACSLFVALTAHRHRERLPELEGKLLQPLIFWALLFLVPTLAAELERTVLPTWLPGVRIGMLGLLGLVLEGLGRRARWPWVRYVPVLLVFLLAPLALAWDISGSGHLLAHGGALGWPLYWASMYLTLRRFVPSVPGQLGALHPIALWGVTLFVALLASQLCAGPLALGPAFSVAAFGLFVTLALWTTSAERASRVWPAIEEPRLFLGIGRAFLGLGVLSWALWVALDSPGDDEVLGYVPVLNPVELAQIFAVFAAGRWYRSELRLPQASASLRRAIPWLASGTAFVLWNGLLARSAHRFFDVPWDADVLWDFGPLQVAVSISWAAIGLAVTVVASRTMRRPLWMTGALLLGVVVVKLFVLDLANLPTLGKIGTFLVVGLLLLVVGYFSPVPPASADPPEPGVA